MADIQEIYQRLLLKGYQRTLFGDLAGQRSAKGGRETEATCPFCGKEGHFSFSSEKALWRCWSCNQGGDWLQYLQEHGHFDFPTALQILAAEAGVELSAAAEKSWQASQRRAGVLEQAQELFVKELEQASTPAAQVVASYLQERGYTQAEIQDMELGAYTLGRDDLQRRLKAAGHTEQEIRDSGLLTPGFGASHTLSLLWRDPAGRALGLACRALEGQEPKYKYSAGLEKDKGLIGLTRCRGQQAVLLVEGVLDGLYLSAKGQPVVATGGTSLSAPQIQALEHNGTRELIVCLDNDSSGQQATVKVLQQLRSSRLRAYVASLPAGVKDPDQLVREQGLEPLKQALKQAESGAKWLARWIAGQQDLQTERGRDRALEQAFDEYQHLEDSLEQKAFLEGLQAATGLQPEDIGPRLQSHAARASEKLTGQLLQTAALRLQGKVAESDLIGAEEELEQSLQRLRSSRGVQAPEPYGLAELEQDILTASQGLETGYRSLDKLCRVPQGAITIVAGRPGHGKTTLQLNLLLRQAEAYQDKAFFFFSYEEARRALAVKLIMSLAGVELHQSHNYLHYVQYLQQKSGNNPAIEAALEQYQELTSSGRLWIVDRRLTAEDLAATISHLASSSGREIGAVFVDYIQKIGLQRPLQGQRYLEIKRVSELLLEQAVAHDLPVILGAQLGRGEKGKASDKVRLDNLRESGDIEQDGNLILGLYNATEEKRQEQDGKAAAGPVALDITVLKNRNGGAGGRAVLDFCGSTYQIKESSGSSY